MHQPLIILDRDGVINYDSDHYIKSVEEWLPIKSSITAIAKLTSAGYLVTVASNQSGLARGLFTEDSLHNIHEKMWSEVRKAGGEIHKIVYCPDHPDIAGPDRKPAPGMLLGLLHQFNANPEDTWFVGDKISDIECALNAGCKPALVLTGTSERTTEALADNKGAPVFDDLLDFVNKILD